MCRFISWKMADPKQSTAAERSSPYKAGVILLDEENRFLLVQNYYQKWTFPKGGIEWQENPQRAAARELLEETGIVLPLSSLRLYYKYYKQTYYVCNASGLEYNEDLINNKTEITGIGWHCFQHLDELDVSQATRKILRLILADIADLAPEN